MFDKKDLELNYNLFVEYFNSYRSTSLGYKNRIGFKDYLQEHASSPEILDTFKILSAEMRNRRLSWQTCSPEQLMDVYQRSKIKLELMEVFRAYQASDVEDLEDFIFQLPNDFLPKQGQYIRLLEELKKSFYAEDLNHIDFYKFSDLLSSYISLDPLIKPLIQSQGASLQELVEFDLSLQEKEKAAKDSSIPQQLYKNFVKYKESYEKYVSHKVLSTISSKDFPAFCGRMNRPSPSLIQLCLLELEQSLEKENKSLADFRPEDLTKFFSSLDLKHISSDVTKQFSKVLKAYEAYKDKKYHSCQDFEHFMSKFKRFNPSVTLMNQLLELKLAEQGKNFGNSTIEELMTAYEFLEEKLSDFNLVYYLFQQIQLFHEKYQERGHEEFSSLSDYIVSLDLDPKLKEVMTKMIDEFGLERIFAGLNIFEMQTLEGFYQIIINSVIPVSPAASSDKESYDFSNISSQTIASEDTPKLPYDINVSELRESCLAWAKNSKQPLMVQAKSQDELVSSLLILNEIIKDLQKHRVDSNPIFRKFKFDLANIQLAASNSKLNLSRAIDLVNQYRKSPKMLALSAANRKALADFFDHKRQKVAGFGFFSSLTSEPKAELEVKITPKKS